MCYQENPDTSAYEAGYRKGQQDEIERTRFYMERAQFWKARYDYLVGNMSKTIESAVLAANTPIILQTECTDILLQKLKEQGGD